VQQTIKNTGTLEDAVKYEDLPEEARGDIEAAGQDLKEIKEVLLNV